MNGYTFMLGGKDYFIVTNQTRKTKQLAIKILKCMDIAVSDNGIEFLMNNMYKATCVVRGEKRQYYEISGADFGGRGSFIDDGNTIIIYLFA